MSTNFYWLPKNESSYDWSTESEKKHPYYTGVTSYEDLTMLNQLPKVRVEASAAARRQKQDDETRVRIHNPSKYLAFQIHLSIVAAESGEEVLPVLWEDNYISLLPGESRIVTAHIDSVPGPLRLEVNGWNIEAATAAVAETSGNAGREK